MSNKAMCNCGHVYKKESDYRIKYCPACGRSWWDESSNDKNMITKVHEAYDELMLGNYDDCRKKLEAIIIKS